ncbi:hypothetical protein D9619_007749 [Psilocybe cf. subviscida]|uniref:Uncharacterized protein n=1 Tax=Psilocybe cf. subviscida TaxID=2480587 RepID=A0A8H5AU32_9AGAR|nr:hypothetical protein D9619_007749 [Psilocybe cf. subviscida]
MALDYEKFKKERISGTKINPFHMITAVTQRAINNQLTKMHKVNPTLRKLTLNSPDPDDDYSALEADLDPPTIELRLNTENRIVIFCFNIKRATLKYLKVKGRKVLEETMVLPSCVLALSVNLTFEGVDFKDLPKDIQNRLKVINDYSVRQLLVDFTSASLARLDKQRTTIQDHIDDPNAQANFNIFMEKYFTMLAERKNDTVLHYLPLATTEGRKQYAMPTVPPTDFTFQNLPFVISATDNGMPSDDNMLVYLQMTGNVPIPRELLPISANWVVPTPDNTDRYDGTVALSREIFLAGWLLPKLAEFNKRSSYVVTDAWWKSTGIGLTTRYFLDGHLGRDDATTEELLFKPVEADKMNQAVLQALKPETPGRWYQYKFNSSKDDNKGLWRVWHTGATDNYMFIPEGYNKDGKCEILLTGTTLIRFYVHVDIPSSTGWVEGKWSTSIILDGINDGELQIKIGDINPQINQSVDEAWLHKGEITHFSNPAKEGMRRLSMTYLLNEMRNVFTDGWDFVLPGAGDFYIHKAVFNREEDLLCELKYKFQA